MRNLRLNSFFTFKDFKENLCLNMLSLYAIYIIEQCIQSRFNNDLSIQLIGVYFHCLNRYFM